MRRLAAFCLSLPLLAPLWGCAASYDKAALQVAALNLHQDVLACETRQVTNTIKNYSDFTACQVAAERNFAAAIHLKNMDAFETYAARMMQLAAERDANHLPPEDVRKRAATIRTAYLAACDCNLRARRTYDQPNVGVFYVPADAPVANSGPPPSTPPQ